MLDILSPALLASLAAFGADQLQVCQDLSETGQNLNLAIIFVHRSVTMVERYVN